MDMFLYGIQKLVWIVSTAVLMGVAWSMKAYLREFLDSPAMRLQNKQAKAILDEEKEVNKEATKTREEVQDALFGVMTQAMGTMTQTMEKVVVALGKLPGAEQPVQAQQAKIVLKTVEPVQTEKPVEAKAKKSEEAKAEKPSDKKPKAEKSPKKKTKTTSKKGESADKK